MRPTTMGQAMALSEDGIALLTQVRKELAEVRGDLLRVERALSLTESLLRIMTNYSDDPPAPDSPTAAREREQER